MLSLIHLYADDTILYTSGPSLDTVLTTLQASFNAIQLSFRGFQLLLNTSKTKGMLFNRSLPAPTRLSNITTLDSSDVKLTILPILDFGDVIYKIASNTLLRLHPVCYHSAIRFVTKAYYPPLRPVRSRWLALAS